MAGAVPRCASICNNVQELLDALKDPASGRATPDLPVDCPFQVDGGLSDDVDEGRADVVPGTCTRGFDEPS